MSYRWIIFDADGTLFDYDRAESEALMASFEQLGFPYDSKYNTVYRDINGQFWKAFEQGLVNQDQLRIGRFEQLLSTIDIEGNPHTLSNAYLKNLSRQTMLVPNAEQILSDLSGQCQFMIITNGLTEVQRPRFRQSSIYHFFADTIISEEVGFAKPDPAIFDIAFEKMHYPAKKEVLIVGDSLSSDIQGGNNYQIDTCWYNPAQKAPNSDLKIHHEISCLTELKSIIFAPATE